MSAGFQKHPDNPIYGDSITGTLFDVYLTPQDSGRLRMDLSWRKNNSAAVAFSEDGVHWSAPQVTLAPNPGSGWEDLINRNCVLHIDGIYKMWYTGQALGHSFIGLAESTDGLHFERVGDEPVLFPERPWEGASVMNPCVLFAMSPMCWPMQKVQTASTGANHPSTPFLSAHRRINMSASVSAAVRSFPTKSSAICCFTSATTISTPPASAAPVQRTERRSFAAAS